MSIFNTTADTYQNSFANPINPANMNSGWGIDPNLLTPSYDAPYRPQYSGAQPYGVSGRPGFGQAVSNVFNPAAQDLPRWGNPTDNRRADIESMTYRPFDSVVWAGQRVAMPLAVGYAAANLDMRGWSAGRAVGRGLGRGLASGMGMAGEGMFSSAARWGAGEALGVGMGLGGMFGFPLVAADIAFNGAQAALFDPYINARQTSRSLRNNLAGVTFLGDRGNAVSGQGLSHGGAARIASQITQDGIRDMTFSSAEYTQMADATARTGLLDDVQAKHIAKRVNDVTKQLKVFMNIMKDPNWKNAMEELSKLHLAGASVDGGRFSVAADTLSGMGQFATAAGMSVNRLMNQAGAQGQYLYQQNGITPYLGQLAAGNMMASFEVARRQGILTTAQLARMGGAEGATQSALTGELAVGQTTFSQMQLLNTYLHGDRGASSIGGSVAAVTSAFGARMSANPIHEYGKLLFHGSALLGNAMRDRGSKYIEDLVTSQMDTMNVPKGKDGKYDATDLMPYLMSQGMTKEQAIAWITSQANDKDDRVYASRIKSLNTDDVNNSRQYIVDQKMYGGIRGTLARAEKNWKYVKSVGATFSNTVNEFAGDVGDSIQGATDDFEFGASVDRNGAINVKNADKFLAGSRGSTSIKKATSEKGPSFLALYGNMYNDANSVRVTAPDEEGASIKTIKEGYDFLSSKNFKSIGRNISDESNSNSLSLSDSAKIITRINKMAKEGNDPFAQAFTAAVSTGDTALSKQTLNDLLTNRRSALSENYADMLTGKSTNFGAANTFVGDAIDFGTKNSRASTTDDATSSEYTKKVDKVLPGSGLDFLDSANVMGSAFDIRSKLEDGSVSALNVDDLLGDKKYSALKKYLKGKKGADAMTAIDSIARSSSEVGLAKVGNFVFGEGDDTSTFDPNRLQDPAMKKKYLAGDEATRRKILGTLVIGDLGGSVTTEGNKAAGTADFSDVMGFEHIHTLSALASAKLAEAHQSGKVNYASVQADTAKTEAATVKDFGDHVREFGKYIKDKTKESTSSNDSTSSLPSVFSVLFGKEKARPAGSPQGDQAPK